MTKLKNFVKLPIMLDYPNTFPFPNEIINGWNNRLKGSELKVLLLIDLWEFNKNHYVDKSKKIDKPQNKSPQKTKDCKTVDKNFKQKTSCKPQNTFFEPKLSTREQLSCKPLLRLDF